MKSEFHFSPNACLYAEFLATGLDMQQNKKRVKSSFYTLLKNSPDLVRYSSPQRAKADRTGLEPATSAVTGRHSNQLNYRSIQTSPKYPFLLRILPKLDGKDNGKGPFQTKLFIIFFQPLILQLNHQVCRRIKTDNSLNLNDL
jgi:hypothetical protein